MDETLKKEYIGRAYFHRAYRYYALVFQYGHIPFLTKLPSSPKLSYRSTHRDAILERWHLIWNLLFSGTRTKGYAIHWYGK